jgi:hypothetical protein
MFAVKRTTMPVDIAAANMRKLFSQNQNTIGCICFAFCRKSGADLLFRLNCAFNFLSSNLWAKSANKEGLEPFLFQNNLQEGRVMYIITIIIIIMTASVV